MNAAGWPAYRQLLLQVVREHSIYRMMVRINWLLGGGAVLVLAATWYADKPRVASYVLALLLWCATMMWCGAVLKSAARQNRPEYACLTPGLRGRLLRVVAILFIFSILLGGLLTAALSEYGGYGLLAAGMMNVYILFVTRYPQAMLVPLAVSLIASQSALVDDIGAALHAHLGQSWITAIGSVLLLILGALGLQRVLPRGGDRHWAWFKLYNQRLVAAGAPPLPVSNTLLDRWRQATWRARYHLALRNDSRTGGTPQRMMVHALGPGAYPLGYVVDLAVAMALLLVGLAIFSAWRETRQFFMWSMVMKGGLLLTVVTYVDRAIDGAVSYRTEQAVFFLSPGAPQARDVNRLLAGGLVRGFAIVWAAALVCVACFDFFVLREGRLRGSSFVLATLMLPFACALLRDYAVMRPATRTSSWKALTFLYLMVCSAFLAVAERWPAVPWFWLGGLVALVSALAVAWRWHKLVALPPVLPAGRLAE